MATSKCLLPEGSACSSASSCASGLCQDSLLCARRPAGTICLSDDQCIGGSCQAAQTLCDANGVCYSAQTCGVSPLNAGCSQNSDCDQGLVCNGAKPGTSGGICTAKPPLRPGQSCIYNGDQTCAYSSCDMQCDGYGNCPFSCPLLPLGSNGCQSSSECQSGSCKAGVCSLTDNGGSCNSDSDCSGGLCDANFVCASPPAGSLHGLDVCSDATQCLTGYCRGGIEPSTICKSDGSDCRSVLRCTQNLADQPCGTKADCFRGTCTAGKCAVGTAGGQCSVNSDCASNLCYNSRCALSHPNESCQSDGDCATQNCFIEDGAPSVTGQ
ncbi:hypothetical protein OC835_007590, partial [Tilletia horrida]